MGCCISKCRPKKHFIKEFNHVQDKLVISQAPKIPKTPIPVSNKISPCPPSPTTSTSSVSSFTCTNSNSVISSCSTVSSGSSILSSKDRLFSNDFLLSCLKENPHVIRMNSIKECSQLLVPPNVHVQKLDSPAKQVVAPPKQPTPQRVNVAAPQKRVRSNSPTTLTRQKSFRREPDRLNSSYSLSSRTLRSPSPSRRFNGDGSREQERLNSSYSVSSRILRSPTPSRRFNGDSSKGILTTTSKESCPKRMIGSKVNATNTLSSSLRKENLRPTSPYINSSHLRSCLRNRETCIHRISSKIDEVAVQEALAHNDDSMPMEDVDNPLISLDCFIFL